MRPSGSSIGATRFRKLINNFTVSDQAQLTTREALEVVVVLVEAHDLLAQVLVLLEESKRAVRQDALVLMKLGQASDAVGAEDRECADGSHEACKTDNKSHV
jgi:hypothetical protein